MNLKSFVSQPLYVQLRDIFLGRIASGHWGPGDLLPNEIDLAREFGLSPGTVRKTLDWMEDAKILIRQQGRGTYVRDPSTHEFVNWYERLRRTDGMPLDDQIQEATVLEAVANDDECARLQLTPGSIVRRTQRTRSSDGRPYMVERSSVPTALFPLPVEDAGKDYPLLELAKRCKVLLGGGEERLSPLNADAELGVQLGCPVGEALLRLDRIVYTISGIPAKWRVGLCRLPDGYYSASVGPPSVS